MLDLEGIVDAYASEIDWKHTMVAFHCYGGDGTSVQARKLVRAYPAICTEWDYPGSFDYVKHVDGKLLSAQTCEDLGVGWIGWRNWSDTKLDRIREKLIPRRQSQGLPVGEELKPNGCGFFFLLLRSLRGEGLASRTSSILSCRHNEIPPKLST